MEHQNLLYFTYTMAGAAIDAQAAVVCCHYIEKEGVSAALAAKRPLKVAVCCSCIHSKGLKYSLATGNWGAQGTQGMRAGVSQVGHCCLPLPVLCAPVQLHYLTDCMKACN